MNIEALVDQHFGSAPSSFLDEFIAWSDDAFDPPRVVEAAEYRRWWERLSEIAGGTMPASVQTDVRAVLGAMAEDLDHAVDIAGPDATGGATTLCRDQLIDAGVAPTGLWQAGLLLDRCIALSVEQQRTAAVLLAVEGGGEQQAFSLDRWRPILSAALAIPETTSSIPTRRMAMAVATWCSHRLSERELVTEYADQFFALDRQADRESGAQASVAEFAAVASATVAAAAVRGDREALDESMRKVRLRMEVDGRLGPLFSEIWARGLAGLDPHLGQLIAQRLLFDLDEAGQMDDDVAYSSAFLLFEMHLAAADFEAAERIAQEWVPRAMEASHGPGVQRWLETISMEADADE